MIGTIAHEAKIGRNCRAVWLLVKLSLVWKWKEKLMSKKLPGLIGLVIMFSIMVTQCVAPAPVAVPAAEAPAAPAAAPAKEFKLAAIFPGVITDADYNTVGYLGVTAVQTDLGVEIEYSESVPVPEVEGGMRESHYNVYNNLFTHGVPVESLHIERAIHVTE